MVEALNSAYKTLEIVRGYYPDALMTTLSLQAIGIRLNYHPALDPASIDLEAGIAFPTPVIYLSRPLSGYTRAFNQEEEEGLIGLGVLDRIAGQPRNVLARLAGMQEVKGWEWGIPKVGFLACLVEDHKLHYDEYLFRGENVWTDDTVESNRGRTVRLIVGYSGPDGLNINFVPGGYDYDVAIFPVLLPRQPQRPNLHLIQG